MRKIIFKMCLVLILVFILTYIFWVNMHQPLLVIIDFRYSLLLILGSAILLIALIFTLLILKPSSYFKDVEKIQKIVSNISDGLNGNEKKVNSKSQLFNTFKQLNDIENNLQKNIRKALHSEKLKVELITNVSHDLRTPLTSIIGNIEIIKNMELPLDVRNRIDILYDKSKKLNDLLNDVFEISKAASGNIRLNNIEFDIKKLIDQTIGELNDKILENNIIIKKDFCNEELIIYNDNERLHRIFQNIIENALKYSLKGTRVYISAQQKDKMVLISIINTASYEMNFTPSEITSRFVRAEQSRTSEGSGLGLAIGKTFTEACNGEFDINIKGDQFEVIISLPLKLT